MPRKAYKRGVKPDPNVTPKELKKRGLSKDQVSVMVALDRSGNVISEPIGRGKISAAAISKYLKIRLIQKLLLVQTHAEALKSSQKNLI